MEEPVFSYVHITGRVVEIGGMRQGCRIREQVHKRPRRLSGYVPTLLPQQSAQTIRRRSLGESKAR